MVSTSPQPSSKAKFSIGYNFDPKLLELIEEYRNRIEALYFPIPIHYLGSGRDIDESREYSGQIPEIIRRCNLLNIKSQLLLNATCTSQAESQKGFFERLLAYLQELVDLGLTSVVVTNPSYIGRIKQEIGALKIESSINCFVKTVEHALYLRDMGVDILTIDRDINRNLPLIKEIKRRADVGIKVILNEGCLRNCPYRVTHFNYLSHQKGNPVEIGPPGKMCANIFGKRPEKLFSIPFIPPEAVGYYAPFVDYFKLSTRVFSTERIKRCLQAYIRGEFGGNLLNILDCPGLSVFEYIDYKAMKDTNYFKKMVNCRENCRQCGYCEFLLGKSTVMDRDFLQEDSRAEDRKAIRIYLQAPRIAADRWRIYKGLSKAYWGLGEFGKAVRFARKVIKTSPEEKTGYLLLGSHYEKMKKGREALNAYRQAAKVFPHDGDLSLGLARAHFLLKEFSRAATILKRIIASNSHGKGVHSFLASSYQKMGWHSRAIAEFRREEEGNSSDPEINFMLAKSYMAIRQWKKADEELKKGNDKRKRLPEKAFS